MSAKALKVSVQSLSTRLVTDQESIILHAPPSKSHTLRAILFASLACGQSYISNILQSPDTEAMISACRQLGAVITVSNQQLSIIGVSGKPKLPDDVINVGNSGQVLRFIGAVAGVIDGTTVLTGDHSIRSRRPLQPLIDGLNQLGARSFSTKNDGHAPLIVTGKIEAGIATIDGQDSQPVSALLIACCLLANDTELLVQNAGEKPWIDLTLSWLDRLGLAYQRDGYQHYQIKGGQCIQAFNYQVSGDFSSIAYPIAFALISSQPIKLCITGIDWNDSQGDKFLIKQLQQMGANIVAQDSSVLVYSGAELKGCDIDVNDLIDALPILAVIGCYAKGTTRLYNAAIAKNKESDRVSVMCDMLKKMGAKIMVTEGQDGLLIQSSNLHGAEVKSYHDHRIAMSLAVAASGIYPNHMKTPDFNGMSLAEYKAKSFPNSDAIAQSFKSDSAQAHYVKTSASSSDLGIVSETVIQDIDCIAKSYPNFIQDMQVLGELGDVQFIPNGVENANF